jgi:hypothetical protein
MNIYFLNFHKMLIPFLLLVTIYCGTAPIAGSETTNGLTVAVVNKSFYGTTVPSSRVFCFSSTYNPDSGTGYSDTVITDTDGAFVFSDCPRSTYTIYAYSSGIDSAAIIQNISNDSNKPDTGTAFQSVASINGTTSSNGAAIVNVRVYIPGTPFVTASDSSGTFSFQNIPKGTFTIHSYLVARWTKGVISDSTTINLSENANKSVTLNLK